MSRPLLIDLGGIDLDRVCLTGEQIYTRLPHRYEFQLLHGACLVDRDQRLMVTYSDTRPDDWWVRGHVPGRPLLPGVLMIEMAAQTSAVIASLTGGPAGFIGFSAVSECKFRRSVVPPARLYVLCRIVESNRRKIVTDTQGVMDGMLAFEARITGIVLP